MKVVAVHNRDFHADDVFAVSILRLIYPKLRVIRTRDENKLKEVDARIDVGRKYDSATNDFDHHQKGGAGERKNGIPYASAGLIWKHYGRKLTNSDEVFEHIDEKIIQYVDANDTGVDTYEIKKLDPYTIAEFINGLNPHWPDESEKLFDHHFEEAVSIISKLLNREIEAAEGLVTGKRVLREKLKKAKGEYLVLEEYLPWRETLVKESNLKFIVFPDSIEKHWCVLAVPVALGSFENRKDLPKSWAGLAGEELQRVTGVSDAKFCHNKLFVAIASSKEGAIKLVELALKNK